VLGKWKLMNRRFGLVWRLFGVFYGCDKCIYRYFIGIALIEITSIDSAEKPYNS
jgi:hypothetical protein